MPTKLSNVVSFFSLPCLAEHFEFWFFFNFVIISVPVYVIDGFLQPPPWRVSEEESWLFQRLKHGVDFRNFTALSQY